LLDFGVGAGRIARHWHGLDGVEVHGTDINAAAVRWCAANLPFGSFAQNELAPPLPYPQGRFDVVYATSVFTHLPAELQTAWAQELRRVLRPAGHLLITAHGETFARARLKADELERFLRGELVVRGAQSASSNHCAAFHPMEYVRDCLGRGFEVLEQRPGGGPEMPPISGIRQDVHLLRKVSGDDSSARGPQHEPPQDPPLAG
jgi:SAM-dependent methyltransferase